MSRNDEVEQLFPFYSMDAVTDEERAIVENYVSSNPEAKARLEKELAFASELALSVQPIKPSPRVKKNVLAYAARRPKAKAIATPAPSSTHSPEGLRRPGLSWWQQLQQSIAMPMLTGAAVALALVLFIWNVNMQRTIDGLESQITALQEDINNQETLVAFLREGSRIPIAGTDVEPGGQAELVLAKDGMNAVLLVSSLPQLPSDQVYQLWYIGDEGPIDRGTFEVGEDGQGQLLVESDTAVRNFGAIGVSIEPRGGSEQPTGDIVLLSEIAPSASDT